MAKKPGTNAKGDSIYVNVGYEDGTVRSNRKIPAEAAVGLDPDASIRAFIEQQDRDIAEKSGLPPREVKLITRIKK